MAYDHFNPRKSTAAAKLVQDLDTSMSRAKTQVHCEALHLQRPIDWKQLQRQKPQIHLQPFGEFS